MQHKTGSSSNHLMRVRLTDGGLPGQGINLQRHSKPVLMGRFFYSRSMGVTLPSGDRPKILRRHVHRSSCKSYSFAR